MLNKLNFSNAINWWVRGLCYLCPAALRKAFNTEPELITIEFKEQEVLLKRYSSHSNEMLEYRQFNTKDDIEKDRVLEWLHEQKKHRVVISLILPDELFLRKKMAFPKAASINLRQVLSFEMNRKTPFSPEQVYFDFLLSNEYEKTDKIYPELFLVPREKIDSNLELLKTWGIKLDAIRPAALKDNCNINLIAPDDLPKDNAKSDTTLLVLITTTCLLLMAILYAPIIIQQKELTMLESAVAKSRKAAIQLQQLQKDKSIILEQSQFLENKKHSEISSIALINEVTEIIPDDTWLSRLVLKANELQLQGESSNASALIQIIDSSKYFSNAQFRSPVTQNKISHKDKFHLSAKFSREDI